MELIRKEYIFADAPFAQCHASTLLCLPGGMVLAAWFGGTREGSDDVMIWLSRREGDNWSRPQCVSREPGLPHWNPVLCMSPAGEVCLYYKVGRQIPYWRTMVIRSPDGGRTWTDPQELVPGDEGGRGPVKNKPIQISDDTILAPASIEQGLWRAFIDRSKDGLLWEKAHIPVGDPSVGMIQPALWEAPRGHVHALLRTDAGRIYRSDSTDFGITWCPAYPISMPNNNSGLDCVRMEDGVLALVCNPVEKNWGERTPLTLFLSRDNGASFQKLLDLETAPGEYSYPAIVSQGDTLHITYTSCRQTIAYCRVRI